MSLQPSIRTEVSPPLDATELEQLATLGYVVLPAFLPDDLVRRLKPEVDTWVDEGLRERSIASCADPEKHGVPPVFELELPAHGELVGHPRLMALLEQVMGPRFAFHHVHSDRQAPNLCGKPWHHDYEQRPQTKRTHVMIHALHYLDGLDERSAALAVLPRSHHTPAEKDAHAHLGTRPIPGETVIDRLPRGSSVVLHSAVFHARRPKPHGVSKPRYMIDTSYCQVGAQWPPVKPYWRHILSRGRELGLDRGRWPDLFAEQHFSEYVKPV